MGRLFDFRGGFKLSSTLYAGVWRLPACQPKLCSLAVLAQMLFVQPW